MEYKRNIIQIISALITNSNIGGFLTGTIYRGQSKAICVPGLNCYSCPGAIGSCPIGALQAVLGDMKFNFSLYILGTMMLFGTFMGRLVCGFLCPFGFVQDLIYKVGFKKIRMPLWIDKPLRFLKYVVLGVFVVAMPLLLTNSAGAGSPYFCKLICPAGTFTAAVPLMYLNPGLRTLIGGLFIWKVTILIILLLCSIFIYRPFCKYLCPLGAFYGFFNRISFYRFYIDKRRCVNCGSCERICPMQVPVRSNPNHRECIRCGKCKNICPPKSICSSMESIK